MSPFFCKALDFLRKRKKFFFLWVEKLLTCLNGPYIVIIYPLKKNQFLSIFLIYLFIPLTPLLAFESRDYLAIERLVKSCYKNIELCNTVLYKIHSYQKNAAINKKFSCQTRLLGLEANLIMAKNFNLKRKDAKNILDAIKKYC